MTPQLLDGKTADRPRSAPVHHARLTSLIAEAESHTGELRADLVRYLTDDELKAWGIFREDGVLKVPSSGYKSLAQGAATTMWCSVSPQLAGMGGVYCEDCNIAELVPNDFPGFSGLRHWAVDQLRECQACGHVGCCDSSPGKHATKHFHETGHPVMRSAMPGDRWAWCYVHAVEGRLGQVASGC